MKDFKYGIILTLLYLIILTILWLSIEVTITIYVLMLVGGIFVGMLGACLDNE